ncbi:MAG: glycosyltransferase family 39 protein [Thermoleophilaceae bacterium]|nr:glycosyltransferase family 39 protein [Thermoleophilaceae bacterium]
MPIALAALVALAAALRFPTLGVQSYWFDETVTANLLDKSLGDLLRAIPDSESTPPLYYVLAWLWAKLFGTGEGALRTLSALAGTATVPVAYAAGKRLVHERAGLAAAALTAVSPFLVWYSQEARAYALLTLLTALAFLFFLKAREEPTARHLAAWAALSALALATHYFALFLVLPMAALLPLDAPSRRRTLTAIGAVVAAGLALLPLALDQASNKGADFIASSGLPSRVAQVPKQFLIAYDAPGETLLAIAAALIAAAAIALLLTRGDQRERRGAKLAAGIIAAAVGIPFVLAIVDIDYLLARNLIAVWLPAALVVATGLAAARAKRAGAVLVALYAAMSITAVLAVAVDERYQRDDWREAAEQLGPPAGTRAIVVTPGSGRLPMERYLNGARLFPESGLAVTEVDLIGLAERRPDESPEPPRRTAQPVPEPGFREIERIEAPTYTLIRYRSAKPIGFNPGGLAFNRLGDSRAAVLVQEPSGR